MTNVTHVVRARDPRFPAPAPAIDRSPEAVAGHLEDAAHFPGGHADGIARPESEGEISSLLRAATHVLPGPSGEVLPALVRACYS